MLGFKKVKLVKAGEYIIALNTFKNIFLSRLTLH